MFILDTNILIGYLAEDPKIVQLVNEIRSQDLRCAISVITEIEILASSALRAGDEVLIMRLLDNLSTVSLHSELARATAVLRRKTKLKLGDAVIAATTQQYDATLITRDQAFIKKLKATNIKTRMV